MVVIMLFNRKICFSGLYFWQEIFTLLQKKCRINYGDSYDITLFFQAGYS